MKKENNTTKEQFKSLLPIKKEGETLKEFHQALVSLDSNSVEHLEEKFEKLPERQKRKLMNATRSMNQSRIMECVRTLSNELGRIPSVAEISANTGLSDTTVYTHIRELRSAEYKQQEMFVLSTQRSKFLNLILQAGLTDTKAAMLALEIMNKEEERNQKAIQGYEASMEIIIKVLLALIPDDKQSLAKKALKELYSTVIEIPVSEEHSNDHNNNTK